MNVIRVLLLDAHVILRQGIRALLAAEKDVDVVGEAGNGYEGLRLARQLLPDVVVVDRDLQQLSGLEVVRDLRRSCPRTEIIVLTTYDDSHTIFEMLKAGARSYLLKDSDGIDLVRAIRGAANGQSVLDPGITAAVVSMFKDGLVSPTNDELTSREREIFKLISIGKTSREIAATLDLSPKTIDNCRARILEKLHARNKTEAIVVGLRMGLIDYISA